MSTVIVIIHVVVCIALILVVLLQTGKGADMGAAFGGGASQTLFGTTGASTFLSKATTAAAIVFMLTSLMLAYSKSHNVSGRLVNETPAAAEKIPSGTTPAALPNGTEKAPPANTPTQPATPPATQDSAPAAGATPAPQQPTNTNK